MPFCKLNVVTSFTVVLICSLLAGQRSALGDDMTQRSLIHRQLQTPITSVMDGSSFRGALERVGSQLALNLCLDRRVDPTVKVYPGQLGPTIFAAIKQIAKERDCVVMPVAGVVLVGKQDWVDQTSAALLNADAKPSASIDVAWDDLTTPSEALDLVLGSRSNLKLPHDLWPATAWKQIDRGVAASLILAQFDRRPQNVASLNGSQVELVSATAAGQFVRKYPTGEHAALVRQSIAKSDRGSKVRATADSLEIKATVTAHRVATDLLLSKLSAKTKAAPNINTTPYSLNETTAPAGALFTNFATTAGFKCLIDPSANKACQKMVTITAKDKTLRELADIVAKKAGVTAEWTKTELRVTLPR